MKMTIGTTNNPKYLDAQFKARRVTNSSPVYIPSEEQLKKAMETIQEPTPKLFATYLWGKAGSGLEKIKSFLRK